MTPQLASEFQRIESVFSLTRSLDADEELLSHWARYLCVLTSGLVEEAMRNLLSQYARRRASPEIARYVVRELGQISNLNSEKFRQLLGFFSDGWREQFETSLTDAHRAALDSVTATRHNIAHGRPVGISMTSINEYYSRVRDVLEWASRVILSS